MAKKKAVKKITLEQSNRSKYGPINDDLIARTYRDNKRDGDVWCAQNVNRYLGRFMREGSSKGLNYTDLLKSRDYLNRMIDANKNLAKNSKEKIE